MKAYTILAIGKESRIIKGSYPKIGEVFPNFKKAKKELISILKVERDNIQKRINYIRELTTKDIEGEE